MRDREPGDQHYFGAALLIGLGGPDCGFAPGPAYITRGFLRRAFIFRGLLTGTALLCDRPAFCFLDSASDERPATTGTLTGAGGAGAGRIDMRFALFDFAGFFELRFIRGSADAAGKRARRLIPFFPGVVLSSDTLPGRVIAEFRLSTGLTDGAATAFFTRGGKGRLTTGAEERRAAFCLIRGRVRARLRNTEARFLLAADDCSAQRCGLDSRNGF